MDCWLWFSPLSSNVDFHFWVGDARSADKVEGIVSEVNAILKNATQAAAVKREGLMLLTYGESKWAPTPFSNIRHMTPHVA